MAKTHDTFTDLHVGTPIWFTASAWLLPLGILAQFVSAGFGLFIDAELLGLHGGIGIAMSLLVIALLTGALAIRRLRGFGWWAGVILALYAAQIVLAALGAPVMLALHLVNASLLLTASIVLVFKIERRRAQNAAS